MTQLSGQSIQGDLCFGRTLLLWPTNNTQQDKAELMAYLLIIMYVLPTCHKSGVFRAKLPKSETKRKLNAKPKTKNKTPSRQQTRKWKMSAGTNGNYHKTEGNCLWTPFPRLQFLSEGKLGTWFAEQELKVVTHKSGTSFSYGRLAWIKTTLPQKTTAT